MVPVGLTLLPLLVVQNLAMQSHLMLNPFLVFPRVLPSSRLLDVPMLVAKNDLAPGPACLHRLRAAQLLLLEASMMVEMIGEIDAGHERGDEQHRAGGRKRYISKDMTGPK